MLDHFFQLTPLPAIALIGSFNPALVCLSYLVAVFSSYIALDITGHLRDPSNIKPGLWLAGGAFAMGAGIWSMHFVGMLAFNLPNMIMHYDPFLTSLSLIIAILASALALSLLKTQIVKPVRLALGGILLGLAIASMHYIGMEAMKVDMNIHYLPGLFFLSILIAIIASEAALWLALKSNNAPLEKRFRLKLISAFIMGAAICGMHYTGMAAAIFTSKKNIIQHFAITINLTILAISIASITFLILIIAIFLSNNKTLLQKNYALMETTLFLKNILESSIEYSIIALDLDKTILTWNQGAKKNYGYEASEMVGKHKIIKLQADEDNQSNYSQLLYEKTLREGKASGEHERIRKDGSRFLANFVITLRKNNQGNPVGYLIISKDISEQKILEQQKVIINALEEKNFQIHETNRLKNEFLANMSHELRTPLNAIIGFSELMYYGDTGSINNEQKDALHDVIASAKHLMRIINDLLDLSKIESGKMEFYPQEINLQKLTDEAIETLQKLVKQKDIDIESTVEKSVAQAYLDPLRFNQILYNLLSNALKFTPNLGHVHIRITPETATTFRLAVEDNGIGIKPEDLSKLFTEFSQLDQGMSKKYPGTGLGLSLTKQLVEAQGGKVGVESTPMKGSTFYVILPRHYIEHSSSIATTKNSEDPALKNPIPKMQKVLIIEDDETDQKELTTIFSEGGFWVESVKLGDIAIKYCDTRQFDIITLDLLLPDISGFEILRKIRSGINKNTPVIVITVVPEEQKCLSFIVNDYLTKPIKKESLLLAIQQVCPPSENKSKIVIIDDDPLSLKLISKLLKSKNYQLICVSNPTLGLETILKEKPDLVVLDLLMAEMSGFDFISHFTKTEMGKEIPLIIWTAKDLTRSEKEILNNSAQAVILKNIADSNNQLLTEIKRLTAKNNL